jgi:hypothetical protein
MIDPHHRASAVFVALFVATFTVPLAVQLSGLERRSTVNEREHRRLAAPPATPQTLDELTAWPHALQLYYDDNFGLRGPLTFAYSNLLYRGLGVVPFGRVHIRSDGWVFDQLPTRSPCAHSAWSGARLERELRNLLAARDAARAAGAEYLLVPVPAKPSVYRVDAPQLACAPADTTVGRLRAELLRRDPTFPVVDLFAALVRAKQRERVYYLDDPHWNDLGAFAAYTELVAAIARRFGYPIAPRAERDFRRIERRHEAGAFARFANLNLDESTDVFLEPRFAPSARRTRAPLPGTTGLWRYETADVEYRRSDLAQPVVLVFRDSFFEPVRPWLAEHFARTTFVWSEFSAARVVRERPTLVLHERNY